MEIIAFESPCLRFRCPCLDEDNIAIFNHIVLPLGHNLTCRPDRCFISELFQNVVVVDNALDEGLLEICRTNQLAPISFRGSLSVITYRRG